MSWSWEVADPPTSLTSAPPHLSWKHIGLRHIVEESSQGFGRSLFLYNYSLPHRKYALHHAKVKFCVQPSSQSLLLSLFSLGLGHRDCDYYQSTNITEYPLSGQTGQRIQRQAKCEAGTQQPSWTDRHFHKITHGRVW